MKKKETYSTQPDYFFKQSGVIPYFFKGGELMVVLIKSRQGKKWIIPKGIIEPDMTPWDSAAKEAMEEAGVDGRVDQENICEYVQDKWGGKCHIKVFLMEVSKLYDSWDEDFRDRKLFPYKKAADKVDVKKLRKIIRILPEIVAKG